MIKVRKFLPVLVFSVLFVVCFQADSVRGESERDMIIHGNSDGEAPRSNEVVSTSNAAKLRQFFSSPAFKSLGGGISIFKLDGGLESNEGIGNKLQSFLGKSPVSLQSIFLNILTSVIKRNTQEKQLKQILSNFTAVQSSFNTAGSATSCGGGALSGDFQQYFQRSFLNNVRSSGFGSFLQSASNFGDIGQSVAKSTCGAFQSGTPPFKDETQLPPGGVAAPESVTNGIEGSQWTQATSNCIMRKNFASPGFCAQGVRLILAEQGLPNDRCTGVNGHDYFKNFNQCGGNSGWNLVKGLTPQTAPPGCALTYNSDVRVPKPNRGTGGGSYGHVELVATTPEGARRYVSDKPRANAGGSVPDNFQGAFCCTGPGCTPKCK